MWTYIRVTYTNSIQPFPYSNHLSQNTIIFPPVTLNYIFSCLFIMESLLGLFALGPKRYISSHFHQLDSIVRIRLPPHSVLFCTHLLQCACVYEGGLGFLLYILMHWTYACHSTLASVCKMCTGMYKYKIRHKLNDIFS